MAGEKVVKKSQVKTFFDKCLDLMEEAYNDLTFYEFEELENKIKAEINAHRI